jgi:hypothetical protein
MMKIYSLLLVLFFNSSSYAAELIEHGCNLIVEDKKTKESGEMELDDFRMLDYNEDNQFIGFVPFGEFTVTSIVCDRTSIVPSKFDHVALAQGYPLYIRDKTRVVVLELVGGKYRVRLIDGDPLTLELIKSITDVVNGYSETEVNHIPNK